MHALSALVTGVALGTLFALAVPLSWNTDIRTPAKAHLRGTVTNVDAESRSITMLLDHYDIGGPLRFMHDEKTLWLELSYDVVDGVIVKEKLQPTTSHAAVAGARISLVEADASTKNITAPTVIITKQL